ncbi:hypothetical protein NHF40_13180 [Maricaulaceae bacterium EIL42A08]|nr:hypothetical protein [Maricaulaceae bacterium EIL42A08]
MMEWLGAVRHVGRPPTRSAVLSEMVASGELSLLDETLRSALYRFDHQISSNEYLWPEAASHLTGATALWDAVEYTSLRADVRVLSFDAELLPLAESELEALVIYQGALRFAVSRAHADAVEILELIEMSREAR